jgi:hypothetical protein
MNERTISSDLTFVWKLVFPTIWITPCVIGTLVLFLGDSGGNENDSPSKWTAFAIATVAIVLIWRFCVSLKRVRIGAKVIIISNYIKEIRVPFDEIVNVTENRWFNIHPVTIYFRNRTAFGHRIIFMPKQRGFSWQKHPIVRELRALAHLPTVR